MTKMKRFLLLFGVLQVLAGTVWAVDHNNLDAGRPLDFDDAESIAWGERAVEFGGALVVPRHGKTDVAGSAEWLYGFKPNSHLSVDFDPQYLTENNGRRFNGRRFNGRRFDVGNIGVGIFHNFNRETGQTPALSLRADTYFPTGRDARGIGFRLRAIASQQFRQYDRLHLNLDLERESGAPNDRKFRPAILLGYSRPLGLPTQFTRTLVAQIGLKTNPLRGENPHLLLGIGVRQQIGVRSVLDFGLKSEISGANREKLRAIVGYSQQF